MGGKWEEAKEKGQVVVIDNRSVGPYCSKDLKTEQNKGFPA